MIYIVGVGPGSKDYLTLKAIEIVKNSDLVVGSKRALALFDIDEGKKVILSKNLIEELKEIINREDLKDKKIAILSTGDPCFSGLLKTLLKLGVDKKEIEVISGISSIQIASSKLKISWEDYNIITLHGKEDNKYKLLEAFNNQEKVIFLPNNLNEDARFLIENGINPNTKIWVLENLTYENERIRAMSLKEISLSKFSYLTVCIYPV
ncbi:precorrin-6y C5,15-methyltransferase (decarboxylating), CbiE subunit [Methanocaldococcus vulcanius M7]|uniref:Precorrin-6y C5,15-methyltransferase (Decarboxylating), CbiE subunit n=1 Tax=Methanocaldococcus vulcanius (strain ATCC 700851 / DSM 12094 / M7) TaxID=579137 RepID=C9REW1_METVM|nr:cobalt-precorrin-7 (C(5))-methyltransferase [Methanocaldococcus vulcanius]ACX72113.1 precorrin-6y C5,15-methyltransferase (decarboxylating), CbiE subunit [Methanocaldococcus vulcanius M7]